MKTNQEKNEKRFEKIENSIAVLVTKVHNLEALNSGKQFRTVQKRKKKKNYHEHIEQARFSILSLYVKAGKKEWESVIFRMLSSFTYLPLECSHLCLNYCNWKDKLGI